MTAAFTPELTLDRLAELSRHVREAVVLDREGRRLAGSPALAEPARQLLGATDAVDIEVATSRGVVYAARSPEHAIAVVTTRDALPALMLYDLRMLLGELEGARA